MEVLDGRQQTLVMRERALLESMVECLTGFGAPSGDVELVRRTLADLEEPLLLVVAGEFDSGKSVFIDALIGARLSEESISLSTSRITLLRYGSVFAEREQREGVYEKTHPSGFLREISVVDTPVVNAIVRRREEHSLEFVTRSDVVLFVTSAERPLTDSGRGYLELVRDWGKKIVLVVNKLDLLGEEAEIDKVRSFVGDGVRSMLGLEPPIFFVSSFMARRAKAATSDAERDALLEASGFSKLESYVSNVLAGEGRVHSKLENPLGVIETLNTRHQLAIDERTSLLDGDLEICENVEARLEVFREDMKRDLGSRTEEIEDIVLRMHGRGDTWFERNIRLGDVAELARGEEVWESFQREVVNGAEALVDERVAEMVGWIVDRSLEQWVSMADYFNSCRQAEYDDHLMAEVSDGFKSNRDELLRSFGENVVDLVRNHDRERESGRISLSLRGAVARGAAVEAGALGLGEDTVTMLTMVATIASVLTLGTTALAGLFVLADRRHESLEEFREKTGALRKKLVEVVRRQLEAEIDRSVERMREEIAPYDRFVRAEQARISEVRTAFDELNAEVYALKQEIAVSGVQSGGMVNLEDSSLALKESSVWADKDIGSYT